MRGVADDLGVDLLIVDTGDRIEGFAPEFEFSSTGPIPLHAVLTRLLCRKRLE